jgi:FRG domain-containing protein
MGSRKRGTRIREVCCMTEHKFLDAISPRSRYLDEGQPYRMLFRGHADARFRLLPSAYRAKWKRPPTNADQVGYELGAIQDFFWLADRCGLPLPEDSQMHRRDLFSDVGNYHVPLQGQGDLRWPPREIWSLLALAQHHGVPTRLLDWSLDARIAGYFAAREAAEWVVQSSKAPSRVSKLAVWAISRSELKVDNVMSELLSSLVKKGKLPKDRGRIPLLSLFAVVTAPAAGNQNLHAQKGVFTLHLPPTMKTTSPADRRPMEQILVDEDVQVTLTKFVLPIARARGLLRLLAFEGISAAELFPGYGGVVKALAERRLWAPEE